jgi:hypothetical protein
LRDGETKKGMRGAGTGSEEAEKKKETGGEKNAASPGPTPYYCLTRTAALVPLYNTHILFITASGFIPGGSGTTVTHNTE